jgi:hypothetical protein
MSFCYFFVFGQVFSFINSFAPKSITPAPDIEAYLSFVMTMFLAFGIAFEVPVALVVLVKLNVVTVEKLKNGVPISSSVPSSSPRWSRHPMSYRNWRWRFRCVCFTNSVSWRRASLRGGRQPSLLQLRKQWLVVRSTWKMRPKWMPRWTARKRNSASSPANSQAALRAGPGTVVTVCTGSPSANHHSVPAGMVSQASLSVSGSVAMTATRSSGVVTSLKSTVTSSSLRWAVANGRLAHDVGELGRGVREQAVAVGEQEVEFAVRRDLERQLARRPRTAPARRVLPKRARSVLQQPAEGALAVGAGRPAGSCRRAAGAKSFRLPLWAKIQ